MVQPDLRIKMTKKMGTKTKNKCNLCNKITGCDNWMSCEICDGWFHASCVKVNDEAL